MIFVMARKLMLQSMLDSRTKMKMPPPIPKTEEEGK